jgi:hypothetical protein
LAATSGWARRIGPVHERPGGDDARAGLFALLDLLAQAEDEDGVKV